MWRIMAPLVLSLALSGSATALEPDRREAVVISARVWDGFDYKETFVPSSAQAFTLMSTGDNVVSFVDTVEYYWPLARQVYVDFDSKRDVLPGTLHVTQNGKLVLDIEQSPYAIIYPEGAINGQAQLVWGAAATQAFADYQAEEQDFARRFVEAQRLNADYERKLLADAVNRKPGEAPSIITPPPPLPEPSLRLVTKPALGYRLALQPGLFEVDLRDATGKAVPGTKRALHVVDVTGRTGIVADIVPEERWTRPLPSNSPDSRLYVKPGSTFFVTLSEADRFDEGEYIPVVSPQSSFVAGRSTWVRRKSAAEPAISAQWQGQSEPLRFELKRLKVDQTQGASFGYRVRPATLDETEDLKAFAVPVPNSIASGRGWLFIDDSDRFRREVIIVQPRNMVLAAGGALLPLFAYVCTKLLLLLRRKMSATGRSIERR